LEDYGAVPVTKSSRRLSIKANFKKALSMSVKAASSGQAVSEVSPVAIFLSLFCDFVLHNINVQVLFQKQII
jgi:hypothetical protein